MSTRPVSPGVPANVALADRLEDVSRRLASADANPFRIRAWARAADTLRALPSPVESVFRLHGLRGLEELPGIGPSLARAIAELIQTGHLGLLDRLREASDPVALLASVPGMGATLAARVHDELGVESLEDLEAALHDGRLAAVPGFGRKKLEALRHYLAGRLAHRRPPPRIGEPDVAELLDVDREYRDEAAAGRLPRIAPRRFNPEHEAWLPVLHTTRGSRHYTALYSNTELAHRLGRTHDWVVLYYDGRSGERQCTVVTARTGALEGQRVIRGREAECLHRAAGVPPRRPPPRIG